MKLLHKELKFMFEFSENSRNMLIVENPTVFSELVGELTLPDSEGESGFVLSENEIPIKRKDGLLCIVDPFTVTLNEKRLLNKLNEVLKEEILSSDLLLEYNQTVSAIEKYALHVMQETDWDLTCSNIIDIQSLFKFMGIQFYEQQETLAEKIMDYIRAVRMLLGVRCFVFINLLSFLTEYEVEKLYEYAQYNKIHILLLESRQPDKLENFTEIIVVDKDACVIELNVQ